MPPHPSNRKRRNRVDKVRASRDGHQFHEAWVARCALGLLLSRSKLHAIAVEGLSEEDEQGASDTAVEIADATFYYGNGTSFDTCERIEVAQFKHSISNADTPLRLADLRKTLTKFAATEKGFLAKYGAERVTATFSGVASQSAATSNKRPTTAFGVSSGMSRRKPGASF